MTASTKRDIPTLKGIGYAALEAAINAALRLDPASRAKLVELTGQVFHLECTRPDFDIYLLPQGDSVQLAARWEGDVTAGLTGTRDDYAELLHSTDPAATLINGNMRVLGDSKALLRLREVAATLDLDWEAPLTRVFGDIVGHQMAQSLRFGTRLLRDAANSLQRQVRDYAREENPWLAQRGEFTAFKQRISDLDARAARLVERAARLRERAATSATAPDNGEPASAPGRSRQ